MRTLVRKRCGSSEEEDEDGGGRDGPRSATDEDFARCPCGRSARGRSQNTQGRAFDRRVSETTFYFPIAVQTVDLPCTEREREREREREGRNLKGDVEIATTRVESEGPVLSEAVLEFLAHASRNC